MKQIETNGLTNEQMQNLLSLFRKANEYQKAKLIFEECSLEVMKMVKDSYNEGE